MYVAISELKALNICLEGDFLFVISIITNQAMDTEHVYPVLQDILQWKNSSQNYILSHIYREANRAVDFIGKKVQQGDCYWNANEVIHNKLATILQEIRWAWCSTEDSSCFSRP